MTEQQKVQVVKLYPIIAKACKIGIDKLSLSFFYNLQIFCNSFTNNSEEVYNLIYGYLERTTEPTEETFLTLFKGV